MKILCYNCHGFRYVYNQYNKPIVCPVCGNRGELEKVEQMGLFGEGEITYLQIDPDFKARKPLC